MDQLIVGSRDSKLALIQAHQVIAELQQEAPQKKFIIKTIKTHGDKIPDVALPKMGDKGLFVKEIESALLQGVIDIAVHSMKDIPTSVPAGLKVAAALKREDPRDVLISSNHQGLRGLPPGASVGTGSLRRIAQLSRHFPHLNFKSIRGNLETRLSKLRKGQFSAIVLAYAGVKRLGWLDLIAEIISSQDCLPAVGQGALAVEIRAGDKEVEKLAAGINHQATLTAVKAERAFLERLEGGCQVPLGSLGEVEGDRLRLKGVIASLDGSTLLRDEEEGPIDEAFAAGVRLAERMLGRGGEAILKEVREIINAGE